MSALSSIDYQPLAAVRGSWKSAAVQALRSPVGILLLIAAIVIAIAGTLMTKSPLLAIFILSLYPSYIYYRVTLLYNRIWERFAAANGWPYEKTSDNSLVIPPSIRFEHNRPTSPVIHAQIGDLAIDLSAHDLPTSSPQDESFQYFTVARVVLQYQLPHIILLSRQFGPGATRKLEGVQKLQLEGDFSRYFELYVEQDQQVDALSVLTPEVMQTLIRFNQTEDIEIRGTEVFFAISSFERSPKEMQRLLHTVVALTDRIVGNIAVSRGPFDVGHS